MTLFKITLSTLVLFSASVFVGSELVKPVDKQTLKIAISQKEQEETPKLYHIFPGSSSQVVMISDTNVIWSVSTKRLSGNGLAQE